MKVTDVAIGLAGGGGIALSSDGKTIYYIEGAVGELSKLDLQTGQVTTVRSGINSPNDVEVDWATGDVFISQSTGSIVHLSPTGKIEEIADPGGAPQQLALVKNGANRWLYCVCADSGRLVKIHPATKAVTQVAVGLANPVGLAIDAAQRFAYVTEHNSGLLKRVDLLSGSVTTVYSGLSFPYYLSFDSAGALWCAQRDSANSVVQIKLGPTVSATIVATGLSRRPSALAPTADGKLIYVTAESKLQVVSANGAPAIPRPKRTFEVSSIRWNTEGSAAISLKRQMTGLPIELPEYLRDRRNEPAAFAAGASVRIQVVFRKLSGFTGGRYAIGATGSHGGVRRKNVIVSIDSTGLSKPIEFELMAPLPATVGKHFISLDWYARKSAGGGVVAMGSSVHTVYVVAGRPVEPWVAETPWVEALDFACHWASGATDLDSAAAGITKGINESGMVQYDTLYGSTYYGYESFALSQLIDRLNGGFGLGVLVNCTDCANAVVAFANLVGCELWASTMEPRFATNKLMLIGTTEWTVPFGYGFAFHEVAWKGQAMENDHVFDACLRVDGDADPSSEPHTPLLATNLWFGDCDDLGYRLRLCPRTEDGCLRCTPQPAWRSRRPVI